MTPLYRYLAATGILLTFSVQTQAERSKKWEGEDAVPAYGDSVPPEAVQGGYREFDERGIKRREIAPALTDEELERKEQIAALREEVSGLRKAQEEQDQRLLDLYPKEDDLLTACRGRIQRLEEQTGHTQDELRRLKSYLSGRQSSAAEAERKGRQPPASLQSDIANAQSRIRSAQSAIQAKEREKMAVNKRCEIDLRRYRELHPEVASKVPPDAGSGPQASGQVEHSVHCESGPECQRFWRVAQHYAQLHATMPVDLKASRIWATASPGDTKDVGITVARLAGKGEGEERIVIDVQCTSTPEGKAFCLGPEVSAIRRNFRDALIKGVLD